MKIISWNVNGLRANVNKKGFEWLINQDADILCLQEIKANFEQLLPNVANPAGYFSYFNSSRSRKGYSGVAVYTKKKPEKVEYGLGKEIFDREGRFLGLFFKSFFIFNVYFPNGGGGPERLKFKLDYYDEFFKYLEKTKRDYGKKIIFCGDVNTAHKEIDLARPKENTQNTGFLPEERAWIDKLISAGYVDTFRFFHPEKKGAYTYWDMKTFARERNVGWRIDYFFSSSDLSPNLASSEINSQILGSDHCPITLEIKGEFY